MGFQLDILRFVDFLLDANIFVGYSHGGCIFCSVGADETLVGLELEYRKSYRLGDVVCIMYGYISLVR